MAVFIFRALGLRGWGTFRQPDLIEGDVALDLVGVFRNGRFMGDYGQCVKTGMCGCAGGHTEDFLCVRFSKERER